jgi:transglutaminase-like putative cysteine protease
MLLEIPNPTGILLTAQLRGIPAGPAGTRATLQQMVKMVRESAASLPIRVLAVKLTDGCAQKETRCEAQSLQEFVRDEIRYVRDPRFLEALQYPEITLQIKAGDCDDKSMMLAALWQAVGGKSRFVAVGFRPGHFAHVYPELLIDGEWIAAETTEPWPLGREPPNVRAKMVLEV